MRQKPPKRKNPVLIGAHIDKATAQRLREVADREERSVSWLIRTAVRDHLDRRERAAV